MTDTHVTLVATCPEGDVCAHFRADLLRLAASHGVTVTQLTVGDGPALRVLQGGRDAEGGDAA